MDYTEFIPFWKGESFRQEYAFLSCLWTSTNVTVRGFTTFNPLVHILRIIISQQGAHYIVVETFLLLFCSLVVRYVSLLVKQGKEEQIIYHHSRICMFIDLCP